jgi:hypothetical protein
LVIRSVIATLALTMGVSPVLSDHCLFTCQAASRTAATSEHSCHRAASSSGVPHHLASDTRPCDHEHGITASLSDDTRGDVLSKTRPMAAVASLVRPFQQIVAAGASAPAIVPPLLLQASPGRILPLRI